MENYRISTGDLSMFDHFPSLYDRLLEFACSETYERTLEAIQPEEGDRILDVGGGTGNLGELVREKYGDVDVYILDYKRSMLEAAGEKDLEDLVQGDSAYLPFVSDSFDYVICTDALHHFEEKRKSLEEMERVTKEKGEVVVSDLSPGLITGVVTFAERLLGEPTVFHSEDSIGKFFESNGYKTDVEKFHSSFYTLKASKTKNLSFEK